MFKHLAVVMMLMLMGAGTPAAQACLHGSSESGADRIRRQRALQLAREINAQQRGPLTPAPRRSYRPLEQLSRLSPTPAGFDLKHYTDGSSYLFSLRDRMDPCNYAIFSDDSGLIYEAVVDNRVVTVPLETR